jgi:hypothetical protein
VKSIKNRKSKIDMEISREKKDKILRNAEILMLKTELLIKTCDGWLSPEEGLKNVEERIRERKKAEKREKKNRILTGFSKWTGLSGLRKFCKPSGTKDTVENSNQKSSNINH